MSSILADVGPPEPKKFRIDMPVDSSITPPADATQPLAGEAPQEGQSPAAPSSARSSNGSVVSTGSNDKEDDVDVAMPGNILEMLSKSFLMGTPFKVDDLTRHMPPSLSPSPKPTTPNMVPGALAVAQSPAAQLFAEIGRLQTDWSWHRNPAASIRSGGTNKQTPVWKYFVYNKAENLSRCIVGDCTYMLKGPHTSTLACHLKKHPAEYAEFQKLKVDYTRERHGGQMPASPSSSSSTISNGIPVPMQKPIKKKESRPDMSNMVAALRNNQPTSPMPNLVQNLLGMNPLQFMINQQVPTSTANLSAAQATSQMLQQAGLTLTPSGQIIPSKKWRRDERRQRELESRLAVALASSHIPTDVLASPLWKELFEVAQPKFLFPDDISIIEQLVVSHHGRLIQAIKSHIAASRKICLIVEAIKFSVTGHDDLQRILVSASFPGYSSGQKYELQTVLMGFRTPVQAESPSESITLTVDQILSEYDIPMEKVTKIACLGMKEIQGDDPVELFDKQMDSFCERLLSAFNHYLENSQEVNELKKTIFALIFSFVAKQDSLNALNKAIGGTVELPLTEHFIVLAEAVFKIKDSIQLLLAQGVVPNNVTEHQWNLLRAVCLAAAAIRQATNGDMPTIDGAIPAIRQLLKTLDTEPHLIPVAEDLKQTIEDHLDSILDVNSTNFDGTYVLSTALNPQLAVLLNDEQIAYAKKSLEKQLKSRLPIRSQGVDALLANVMNQSKMNGSDLAANPLYADLFQQANDRIQQEKNPSRDRMAEAVVSTYFDEILNGNGVDALLSPFSSTNRSFGHPFQPPLLFWQQAAGNHPQMADLAQELLCIPQAPPAAGRLFCAKMSSIYSPWKQLDASLILSHLEKGELLERDLLLRANRSFLPKTY